MRFSASPPPSFGALWETSLHKRLIIQSSNNAVGATVNAARGASGWVSFTRDPNNLGSYLPDNDVSDRLTYYSVYAVGWFYRYFDASTRAQEVYDINGVLQTVSAANGTTLSYSYTTTPTPVVGLLRSVIDQFGRGIQFSYEQPAATALRARIVAMTTSDGRQTNFAYDETGNLQSITWPDLKIRQFLYKDTRNPWAMTGVIDERQVLTATVGYDDLGRATSSQRADGVSSYAASWSTGPGWIVTETLDLPAQVIWRDHSLSVPQGTVVTLPNGQFSSFGFAAFAGAPRLTSQSQPGGSGCAESSSTQAYDGNGNVVSVDDFNGNRACYAQDRARNLEMARVEGLAGGAACTVTGSGVALPNGSRKVSTEWHPDWKLQAQVAEPGRKTTYVYNGRPDPLNNGAIVSCAPNSASLPDGKPIAVLCKQTEQATGDGDGSQAFAASLQAGVPSRVRQWTYNQYGQVVTAKDALNNITSYGYYADTAFTGSARYAVGHTKGDLQSVTNSAGHVTQYSLYNKAGQVLQMVDPNGVITVNQYDARQRLTGTSVGGQTTAYEYWPTGLLQRVTQPDGNWVNYQYDDAHRLVRVSDGLGSAITYTLDNSGNRTGEEVRDPGNTLRRQLIRNIDALGRVEQITGRQ